MSTANVTRTDFPLNTAEAVHFNLAVPELIEHAISAGEGQLAANGALVAYTGKYTGRTPKDKRIVRDMSTESRVWWDNNLAIEPALFDDLFQQASAVASGKKLYVVDCFAGADPSYRIAVRFIVENAYHALFIRQLLLRPSAEELSTFVPEWTVVDFCREKWRRIEDGEERDAVIALDFTRQMVLIMGTAYAGEMKKSVFTIMNYLLPQRGVLSMHCSANTDFEGNAALFFGLSGTGKTTLSADPSRRLIGDDEHGWSVKGVFNIEGGCYAKCIKLSQSGEPQIWDAIRFGAVLENVVMDQRRVPDFDDGSLTENTRCAYPVDHIEGAVNPSIGGHPKHVFFLTCDALGVLPPISRLTGEQAMYHFLNGYTAKVAGTEAGVTEPQLTFSTCFGAPFLPLHPSVYAEMLRDKIQESGATVWLVNTGWSGGRYGTGQRIKLDYTRAMINAAIQNKLDSFEAESVFGLSVPSSCPEVPKEILQPRSCWSDPADYDRTAQGLREKFDANFVKFADFEASA